MNRTATLADPPPSLSPMPVASGGPIGWVVLGALAGGLLAAVLLAAAPFVPPTEAGITGAVLCGLALGWAMLGMLSARFTAQPQQWAFAPAAVMGVSGVLLVAFDASVLEPLSWVWPPVMLVLAVWAIVRARRDLHHPIRRWLLSPVLALLALASLGGGLQTVREAATRADSMPGQLVDIGSHRLHLSCTGSGSPTVVVEPGAGMVSAQLNLITPTVADGARVCGYDRAGRGWSDPAPTNQDAAQIATDLHALLERGGVPGPYVLAGHSFGGLYVLTFADRYPDDVAGMVLIDSTAPASPLDEGAAERGDERSSGLMDRVAILVSTSARLGLTRLIDQPTPSDVRSTIEEYSLGGASARQAAEMSDFAEKPLIVLTAGIGHDADKSAAQDALATLSTNSVHRVVDRVDHPGMILDQDGASATSRAILDVVSSVQTSQRLVG
ncbi:alpha/beta hydrolase [Cellulomonas fimi]|uniref:alpha/beta fold hydrolase n=1 Tax=Cellulomonas fimi TaxID=1708 RepID=UPI00234C3B81|nr:alpha/beta fold hydrolase [Cellulomonas fimi]MDC7120550.1 alpha/beta hydrolase [Cellulomonas fimi]